MTAAARMPRGRLAMKMPAADCNEARMPLPEAATAAMKMPAAMKTPLAHAEVAMTAIGKPWAHAETAMAAMETAQRAKSAMMASTSKRSMTTTPWPGKQVHGHKQAGS